MKVWFEVISELFVNIAAAWFVAALVDTQTSTYSILETVFLLILKVVIGIISLFIAKYLREEVKRRRR